MDSDHRISSTHSLHNDETGQVELSPSDPNNVEEEETDNDDDDDDYESEDDDDYDYDYDDDDDGEEEDDDDEDDDNGDEDDEDDEEDEEEEQEHDGDNVDYVGGHPETTSHQVLHNNRVRDINSQMAQQVVNVDDLPAENANEAAPVAECDQRIDIGNNGQIDGLFCPICSEPWSSGGGDHHVCCLPCGHMYGFSCIDKWLRRPGSRKCPQCRKKCGLKGIRLLYASRVVAVDGELQKTVESLEAECASLRRQNADLTKREADLSKQLQLALKVDAKNERDMREKLKSMNEMMKPMYEMVNLMYEWHIGQGHVERLPPH